MHSIISRHRMPVLLGALLLIGTSVPGGLGDDVRRETTGSGVQTENSTALSGEVVEALLRLREQGPDRFPESFGEVASGPPNDEDLLVVYLFPSDSGAETSVREFTGLPADKIQFRPASMTSAEADALDARFTADAPELLASGIRLTGWGIGEGVVLEIELLRSGDAAVDEATATDLAARYGQHVRVVLTSEMRELAAGRAHDSPEWRGGSFLNVTSGRTHAACTSGFALTWPKTGNKYILTAGHCYGLGARVFNGIGNVAGGWSSNLVGTVTNRSYNIGYPDAALIQADGRSEAWTGSSAAPSGSMSIDVLTDPWRSMPLCIDGAFEGEYCGMTVGNPDKHVTIGGVTFAHQAELTSSNPQAAGHGDSGGPAYATILGVTYGVGIISSTNASTPCVSWSAQVGGRSCGNNVAIQNIEPVLEQCHVVLDR